MPQVVGKCWKDCPDEKGIETCTTAAGARQHPCGWKDCPDEKGIETGTKSHVNFGKLVLVGRTAPMRRGLRHFSAVMFGWTPPCWKDCPDEKGIETVEPPGTTPEGKSLEGLPR